MTSIYSRLLIYFGKPQIQNLQQEQEESLVLTKSLKRTKMCYKKILQPVIPPPKLPAAEVTVTTEVVATASVRDDGGEKKVCVCVHRRSIQDRLSVGIIIMNINGFLLLLRPLRLLLLLLPSKNDTSICNL